MYIVIFGLVARVFMRAWQALICVCGMSGIITVDPLCGGLYARRSGENKTF